MTAIVDEIFDLFARLGQGRYGEDVSLERHMLQAAAMAQSLGAPGALVVAALLHDIGYFLHPGAEASVAEAHNFEHEALGAAWLSRAFGDGVTQPIALHVEAKRYLCAVEPGYFDRLSDMSRHTLMNQGGIMSRGEAAAFEKVPAFEAALLLRRCDDRGKDVGTRTPSLADYRALMVEALRP